MALAANAILVGLSLVLGIRLLRSYLQRAKTHTLWYGVGILLIAVAAFPELYHQATGTVPTLVWWLYWSTGSTLVGFLAVGTAYLLSQRFGQVALGVVALLAIWVLVATVATTSAPADITAEMWKKAPNAAIKLPFLIQNILGSLLIFGGAILSFIRTRGIYCLWIALGTLLFASGGAAAGLLDFPGAFYFAQAAGMVLLYLGVTQSGGRRPAVSAGA